MYTPPPMPSPSDDLDPGYPLTAPDRIRRKTVRLVAFLWAASRPGGVTRAEASRIVAPELDPDGESGLRKIRRYVCDLRDLGLVVEQDVEPSRGPVARVRSIAVRGVDFRVRRLDG
jgi:hypothetical protein